MGAATRNETIDGGVGRRLRGRECADSCGGRRARKTLLTFGFPIKGAALCHSIFVCVLCPVLYSVNFFIGTTTGWTRDVFGRQNEEALLVKQEKPSST